MTAYLSRIDLIISSNLIQPRMARGSNSQRATQRDHLHQVQPEATPSSQQVTSGEPSLTEMSEKAQHPHSSAHDKRPEIPEASTTPTSSLSSTGWAVKTVTRAQETGRIQRICFSRRQNNRREPTSASSSDSEPTTSTDTKSTGWAVTRVTRSAETGRVQRIRFSRHDKCPLVMDTGWTVAGITRHPETGRIKYMRFRRRRRRRS